MRRNGRFFINEDMLAGAGRVFSQVVYLIWIWELYLSTGDKRILEFHHAPLKRCLSYIESRTDSNGIVTQVYPDDWQYSEGADWVDWCPERMEGSTCVYHTLDGTITWNPRIPASIKEASMPFRHLGDCWKFGCTEKNYWIDPGKAVEKVRFSIDGKPRELQLNGKGTQFPRTI